MNNTENQKGKQTTTRPEHVKGATAKNKAAKKTEHGGPKGPEPTRYGDWERNGRCTDF